MNCEYRILRALKDHPKGLGVRELKRKTSEKCVRLWLPKLYGRRFVKYPNVKRGQKKLVFITDKGLTHRRFLEKMDVLEKEFLKNFGVSSTHDVSMLQFEKKLDLYERVLMDIFDVCLKADPKFALRFLKLTLFVIGKVLEKKRYDYDTRIRFLKAIKEFEKMALG